jgi:single-strand DNA-binding protein
MNKVILSGNIGKDPETKFTPSGKQVATFSLATKFKDKTQWHNITIWGMEKLVQLLKKGMRVLVIGRIEYNDYEKDGKKTRYTNIVATEVEILSKKQVANSNKDEGFPF